MSESPFLHPDSLDFTVEAASSAEVPFSQDDIRAATRSAPNHVRPEIIEEILEMLQFDIALAFFANLDTLFTPVYRRGDCLGIAADRPVVEKTVRRCVDENRHEYYQKVTQLHQRKYRHHARETEVHANVATGYVVSPDKQGIVFRTE